MRKPTICIGENKDADQLQGYSAFVFDISKVQSLLFLNLKFKGAVAVFCGCTAWFVSDLLKTIVGFLMRRLNYLSL